MKFCVTGCQAEDIAVSGCGKRNLIKLMNTGVISFLNVRSVLGAVLLFAAVAVRAQIHVVKDVETFPSSSVDLNPVETKVIGSRLYFYGFSNAYGYELWKTDATAEGTSMVSDIWPGTQSSNITLMTEVNGTLFFLAENSRNGKELWKSDGSAQGTVMVKDIREGSQGTDIVGPMAALHDSLFFFVRDNSKYQLWASPRLNAEGTVMVKEFATNNYEHFLTVSGDHLFFAADIGNGEIELWKSNGKEANTVVVEDIEDGVTTSHSSQPQQLTDVNGMLYFSAVTPSRGRELWRTDGTSVGSWDLHAGAGSSYPSALLGTGGKLYFKATNGSSGHELWVVNDVNTLTMIELVPGTDAPFILTNTTKGINGDLYFAMIDAVNGDWELWKSDGTAPGTFALVPDGASLDPRDMTYFKGNIYFAGSHMPGHGSELYRTDGTVQGTAIFKDIWEGENSASPNNVNVVGDKLCFWANDGMNGRELWVSDGIAGNTKLLSDVAVGTQWSDVPSIHNVNGTLYFPEKTHGLLKTDGTAEGTISIEPFEEGDDSYTYDEITATEGGLYYVRKNLNTNLYQLYRSNGSVGSGAALTNALQEIYILQEVNGILYFAANDGTNGREFWMSDGTPGGTRMVKDINPGAPGSYPAELFSYKGAVYFRARNAANGLELWKCEGNTALGTTMVKDINPGPADGSPFDFKVVNDIIYFNGTHSATGQELWRSDGTDAGTYLLKDIMAAPSQGSPAYLQDLNGVLYFVAIFYDASANAYGRGLWKSNGSEEGTLMVANFGPGVWINDMVKVGELLYVYTWSAVDRANRLWKSDGTAEGTQLIMNLDQSIDYMIEHQGHLFFLMGTQLWKSDGDACNTFQLSSGNDVAAMSDVTPVGVDDKLYFIGVSNATGAELFYYDFSTINDPQCVQSVIIADVEQKTFGDEAFALEVTATSTMDVSLESSNPLVATVNGKTVTIVGAGEVTFTATQAGDNRYAPASSQKTIVINKALATWSVVSSEKVYTGSALQVEVTTTPAGLDGVNITYRQNGNTVDAVNAGVYDFEASLQNPNYAAEVLTGTFTIAKADQFITFASLEKKIMGSDAFDPGATSSAGLNISYTSSNPAVATIADGKVVIVSAGTTTITATQNGNDNYQAAPAVSQGLTVVRKTQTLTFDAIPAKIYGEQPFMLSAEASSGLPVTFSSSDNNIATIAGNTVTLTGPGEVTITASQPGSPMYDPATAIQVLVVDLTTGLDAEAAEDIRLYPNPSIETIVIEGSGVKEHSVVRVMNTKGAQVDVSASSVTDGKLTLDVRHMAAGVYVISIVTGRKVATQRFVKK